VLVVRRVLHQYLHLLLQVRRIALNSLPDNAQVHCGLRADHDVLFITHNKLLAQFHAVQATNTYKRKLQQFAKVELIAIDDFGLRPMRSPQQEEFHELIAERYERTTTLVTSKRGL